MTVGRDSRRLPAKTLYELLRVRRDDDAETLQSAYRNAAKAHHPDLNPGDPDAPRRFRQISSAYAILRNAEHREAYHRLLDRQVALERAQRRAKLRRTILSDAAAIVAFSVVLVGGYTLYGHMPKTSVDGAKVVEVVARKPADMTAVQPATRAEAANQIQHSESAEVHVVRPFEDSSHRGEPSSETAPMEHAEMPIVPSDVEPEEKSNEPVVMANRGPDSDPSVSNNAVTGADDLDTRVDRGNATNSADDRNDKEASNPIDQNNMLSVEPPLSPPGKDTGVVKSTFPVLAKHDSGTTRKLRVPARRPATERTSARQAVAENKIISQVALESRSRSACAGSCSAHPPPLFGVGF